MSILFGTNGADILNGSASGDLIFAGKGDDTINAGAGNDLVFAGKGDDIIDGGEGNDFLFGGKGADTIDGGAGNDLIFGGKGDDVISGGEGSDLIFAGKGDDTVSYDVEANIGECNFFHGGKGNDTLSLKLTQAQFNEMTIAGVFSEFSLIAGSRTVFDFSSFGLSFDINLQVKRFEQITIEISDPINEITGTAGDDFLAGTNGDDIIYGLAGNDQLSGLDGDDQIFGGDGNDILRGGNGTDVLDGGNGNDLVFISDLNGDQGDGGAGSDTIVFNYSAGTNFDLTTGIASLDGGGGSGTFVNFENAQILGGGGTITGTNNANGIVAFNGNHTINLLDGNDVLSLDAGGDVVDGGDGVDRVRYLTNDDVSIDLSTGVTDVLGVQGSLTSVEWVETRGGNDTIIGSSNGERIETGTGSDFISSGDGDDLIFVSDGDDTIDGGAGSMDTLTIVTALDTFVDLAANTLTIGSDPVSSIVNVERIVSGSGNDVLVGDANDNTLIGSAGNDSLEGGLGTDILRGGAGNDTFIFNAGDGADRLIDFDAGVGTGDVLDIQAFGFADLAAAQGAMIVTGTSVLLQLDAATSVLMDGRSISDFAADDFIF